MDKYSITPEKDFSLEKELEYPELLLHLLESRGLTETEAINTFLEPDYERDTHDPFLLKDMDKVVERIAKAIKDNEHVVIYSDYDADGIPGGVVLHDFFKKAGHDNFHNYIPDRHEEGFGFHFATVPMFKEKNAKLIITIDCGITDCAAVEEAHKHGIDVIITDHHEPHGDMPKAFAVINPKQPGCEYPEKMLCGAGVAFKIVQALMKRKELIPKLKDAREGWEKWLLDMVGIATLSDMVPLTGENRVFAYYGLKVLRISPRIGLSSLLRKAGTFQKRINEDDIAFTVTPRINAASRMGVPIDAFKVLSSTDPVEAGMLVSHLQKINDERKGIVASLVKEVRKKLEARESDGRLRDVIVMGNPDWRPSLLGLVANSLKEEHGRPVFLWGRADAKDIKGSCRSESVSVVDLMSELGEYFIHFGGHKLSGGFAIEQDKIHTLEDKLNEAYKKIITSDRGEREKLPIDKKLRLLDVNRETWKLLQRMAPFGHSNPKPVFLFENVTVDGVRPFGKEKQHIELKLTDTDRKIVPAISFFANEKDFIKDVKAGDMINLIATMEESNFGQYNQIRLRIQDIV